MALPNVSAEDRWPPPELEGAWSIKLIAITVDGAPYDFQRRIPPTIYVFAGDYLYMFSDNVSKSAVGAKLRAHEETDDAYFLIWSYFGQVPGIRIQIQKEDHEHLRMVTDTNSRGARTLTTYQLTRAEKARTTDRIKRLLDDKALHASHRYFRGDSETILAEWLDE